MTSYHLLDRPVREKHWHDRRRTCRHGVASDDLPHLYVMHTTEQHPDLQGVDGGAEAIAEWCRTTTTDVSWHLSTDSDSRIPMLPDRAVAWHVRGYNRCGYGTEQATKAHMWDDLPDWWTRGTIVQSANGIWRLSLADHPARDRFRLARPLTKAEADAGLFGFVAHSTLDPGRRSDPGDSYDWHLLLSTVRRIKEGTPMGLHVYCDGRDVATAMAAIGAFRLDGDAGANLSRARRKLDAGETVVAFGGPAARALYPDLADRGAGEHRDGNRIALIGATGGDTYNFGRRLAELAAS